ncbi:phosphatase [Domibacillus sp. 8LH]|uniref:phosphatase n=1 Tax=Domibacillus sp. 8LH TaxID=3073900 RepID=UPI00317A3156
MNETALAAKREYQRQWRSKNRDKANEYKRQWCKKNPDKVKQYQERHYMKKAKQQEEL